MDIKARFFGRGISQAGMPPVANSRLTDPPVLGLLFAKPFEFDVEMLTKYLHEYHEELSSATAELQFMPPQPGTDPNAPTALIGLIAWGRHVVKVVGYNNVMAFEVVDKCVRPGHYDPALKEEAYGHAAHVTLFYAGYDPDPIEQYVVLSATAAAFTRFGALVVLNEAGRTSIPAMALLPHVEDDGNILHTLRTFPIPMLYAGFVKLEIDGLPGIWMRTYGCPQLGLSDLAFYAETHGKGVATFNLFAELLAHLRETNNPFAPGDLLNVGEGMNLRVRERTADEWFLESNGQLLVVEPVAGEEAKV